MAVIRTGLTRPPTTTTKKPSFLIFFLFYKEAHCRRVLEEVLGEVNSTDYCYFPGFFFNELIDEFYNSVCYFIYFTVETRGLHFISFVTLYILQCPVQDGRLLSFLLLHLFYNVQDGYISVLQLCC